MNDFMNDQNELSASPNSNIC